MGYGDMGFRGIEGEDADSYERRYKQACHDNSIRQYKMMGFGSVRLGKIMDWVYAVILVSSIVGFILFTLYSVVEKLIS